MALWWDADCLGCRAASYPFTKTDGRISQCPTSLGGNLNKYPSCGMIFQVKSAKTQCCVFQRLNILESIITHCAQRYK